MSELTPDEKEQIRKYLISLFAIPTIIIAAVSFVLGFFVNEAARGAAYVKAFGDAQKVVVKTASEAARSAADAESARNDAREVHESLTKLRSKVKVIVDEAEKYQQKLKTVVAVEDKVATDVAKSLLETSDFLTEKVTGAYGERLQNADDRLTKLENNTTKAVIFSAVAS